MANSDANPVVARDPGIWFEFGEFTTVNDAAATGLGGIIATLTRTGEGTFTGTLKRGFPQVRQAVAVPIVAGGGQAVFTALDPVAKTFALLLSTVAGVASDLPGAVVKVSLTFANTKVTRR